MALFITFEGGEGSGKSTQAKLLHQRLKQLKIPSLLAHEPGETPLGEKISGLLKWRQDLKISPAAELLLFNSSRAQLVNEVIKPALQSGTTVICDRYADSTTAYQGYGRGLETATVMAANKIGMSGVIPDITFLLDMAFEPGLARKSTSRDRFEKESEEFHRRVREGYLTMAKAEPERWHVIDATLRIEEIAEEIRGKLEPLL